MINAPTTNLYFLFSFLRNVYAVKGNQIDFDAQSTIYYNEGRTNPKIYI